MPNPFEILGIPENSEENQIKKRFRELLFQYHPDVSTHSNIEKTKIIIQAFKDALTQRKRGKLNNIQETKKYLHKIDIFLVPKDEKDIYKIIHNLLSNFEKYYYSDLDTLTNILEFLDRIINSDLINNLINNKNIYTILDSFFLIFSAKRENLINKRVYSFNFENYKLAFFDYLKNIFKSKDYINYRIALNVNSNILINKNIELLKIEKEENVINEILGILIIILLLSEEDIYENLFQIFKDSL